MKFLCLFCILSSLLCPAQRIDHIIVPTNSLIHACRREKAKLEAKITSFSESHERSRRLIECKKICTSGSSTLELIWIAPFFYEGYECPYNSDSLSVFWSSNKIVMVLLGQIKYKISVYDADPVALDLKTELIRTMCFYDFVGSLGDGHISQIGVFVNGAKSPVCFAIQYGAIFRDESTRRVFYGDEKSVTAYKVMEHIHDFLLNLYKNGHPEKVCVGCLSELDNVHGLKPYKDWRSSVEGLPLMGTCDQEMNWQKHGASAHDNRASMHSANYGNVKNSVSESEVGIDELAAVFGSRMQIAMPARERYAHVAIYFSKESDRFIADFLIRSENDATNVIAGTCTGVVDSKNKRIRDLSVSYRLNVDNATIAMTYTEPMTGDGEYYRWGLSMQCKYDDMVSQFEVFKYRDAAPEHDCKLSALMNGQAADKDNLVSKVEGL